MVQAYFVFFLAKVGVVFFLFFMKIVGNYSRVPNKSAARSSVFYGKFMNSLNLALNNSK